MMCDNLSRYSSYVSSSTNNNTQFYPMDNGNHCDQRRSYLNIKRKLSDYEENHRIEHVATSFEENTSDDEENEDEEEEEEESSDDDETHSEHSMTRVTTPCTITQRRHSDTLHSTSSSYGTPIVKRRCTFSSMHDEEQKRSVLVESYRKLRGVKKPKLQVSLLICNLIKRLEKTFTKTSPPRQIQMANLPVAPPQHQLQLQEQQQQQLADHSSYVQYYHRTSYRSSSSDSIYMTPSTLITDETERSSSITQQQYSPPHSSNYDSSDKVLLPVSDLRSTSSMYHHPSSSTDAYWLAQSNFAVPVVMPTSDEDDVDVSLHGHGDYLDLSDNTLASSFSSCSSSSQSPVSSSSSESIPPPPPPTTTRTTTITTTTTASTISSDCCCSSTTSPTITKLLVDTNNNHSHHQQQQQNHHHNDYFLYHHQLHSQEDCHQHSSNPGQPFFYHHHNGTNTVDIITTA